MSVTKIDLDPHPGFDRKRGFDVMDALYKDEQLTDFILKGKDGSVKVHKLVLAASSPVFASMLAGDWKESNEEYVNFDDTLHALIDFKRYIYVQPMHANISLELLTIAMRYMMTDLEDKCINILLECMTPRKFNELIEFAVLNSCDKLKAALLKGVEQRKYNYDGSRPDSFN